jgi:hypothetical protein
MKFTTPCFVRVEDAEKRDELLDWLQDIGYDLYQSARSLNYPILCCNMIDDEPGNVYGEYAEELTGLCGIFAYDCGENIELFKALAAMNDENDREQWFTDTADDFCLCSSDRWSDEWQKENFEKYYCYWRKATAEEIIGHFKRHRNNGHEPDSR